MQPDQTTMMSTKGQVILPKALRSQLGWDAGTRLAVEQTEDAVVLRPVKTLFKPTVPEEVFGCLAYEGPAKSIEEMDAAVTAEMQQRNARGRY